MTTYNCISRVGQNRIYTPEMTVYSMIFLPIVPCMHRIYMVLAKPMYKAALIRTCVQQRKKTRFILAGTSLMAKEQQVLVEEKHRKRAN
jgi:hypothetical protein